METLLDLNGCILDQGDGYWVKIEAWRVERSASIPHGIRYSLTLHEPFGHRVLGYDNAHSINPAAGHRRIDRIPVNDHRHSHAADKGKPYRFSDAHQLLLDFFVDVDRVLVELKQQ